VHFESVVQIAPTKPKPGAAAVADDREAAADGSEPPQTLCFDTANVDNHGGRTRMVRRGRGGMVVEKLEGDDQPPDHWSGGMSSEAQVMRSQDGDGKFPLKDRVQQLHVEQLVLGARGPVLESRDANDFRNGKARTAPTDTADDTPITRTRLGRISLSTSWEPSDAGPLVSFSESWGNRPHDE
jgi:hypothetical protein